MALSVPSFLFHDKLYAGSGVDSAYVLQEKHDSVFEKNKKLEEQMTPLSTSFLSIKVLSKGTRCMILGLEQVAVLVHMSV
jgi:hypothetical protein